MHGAKGAGIGKEDLFQVWVTQSDRAPLWHSGGSSWWSRRRSHSQHPVHQDQADVMKRATDKWREGMSCNMRMTSMPTSPRKYTRSHMWEGILYEQTQWEGCVCGRTTSPATSEWAQARRPGPCASTMSVANASSASGGGGRHRFLVHFVSRGIEKCPRQDKPCIQGQAASIALHLV